MRDIHDVIDDFFKIFEGVDQMFRHWTSAYHQPFIDEVRKIDLLDRELEEITGDKQLAYLIRVGIYRSVFPYDRKYKQNRSKMPTAKTAGDHIG